MHATWKACILLVRAASLSRRSPSKSAQRISRDAWTGRTSPKSAALFAPQVPQRADRPDVTGGMLAKVERLYKIARRIPGLDARIVSGLIAGTVESALCGGEAGTAVRC